MSGSPRGALASRWLCAAALLLALLLGGVPAVATAASPSATAALPLTLSDGKGFVDAWPAVSLLEDTDAQWTADALLGQPQRFTRPQTQAGNLGVIRHPVWFRLALQVPAGQRTAWLLDIDYASLDRVEVFVFADGRRVDSATLGDHMRVQDKRFVTRSHALPLDLAPGQTYQVLIRVETTSSLIVPIHFMPLETLTWRESRFQMAQGLMIGLSLCLLVYSLSHGLTMRDGAYVFYAMSVGAIGLFFMAYHGLAAQYLWDDHEWLRRNAAPLMIFPGVIGGLLFLSKVLEVPSLSPRLSKAMSAGVVAAVLAGAVFVLGVMDYRGAHLAGTLLGPLPFVLGLPAAFMRARQGDRAAMYILAGWAAYAVGIFTMALFLRGMLPVNAFTANAFQVGAMAEMIVWMVVLSQRTNELRRQVERADLERESMRALAHTDALTGLPNRRGLEHALRHSLGQCTPERQLAVYMLDLDGFKAVNDRCGHDIGDELLVDVASRLRQTLRSGDVVARLGGDEFVVVAPNLRHEGDAASVGQKMLSALSQPFLIQGHELRVGLTAGYAIAPGDGRHEIDLLKRADAAMYVGKQAGKHCVRRSDASLEATGA